MQQTQTAVPNDTLQALAEVVRAAELYEGNHHPSDPTARNIPVWLSSEDVARYRQALDRAYDPACRASRMLGTILAMGLVLIVVLSGLVVWGRWFFGMLLG